MSSMKGGAAQPWLPRLLSKRLSEMFCSMRQSSCTPLVWVAMCHSFWYSLVTFPLRPCVPRLLTWKLLWFLTLAAGFPETQWALLTNKPPAPTEPWSLPDLLLEMARALPPQPQPEGSDDPASSAPSLGLTPSLKPSEQTGISQVLLETQTRNPKTAKVQSSSRQQEVKYQLSQAPEEAEPPVTRQDSHARYELGTEEDIDRLLMYQEANASSQSRSEAHHSNMPFVTEKPVDMKVTKSTVAAKKPQPPSSQLQALTKPPESPAEEEPFSDRQEVLAQTPELSEELEISSTHQEAPAQPLGPPVEAELFDTKTKPTQPSESSRKEEPPSESQLEAPAQPSEYIEDLETEQPAQFSENHAERVSAPPHHKAEHPHLPHMTGEPPNLQLAITPEPTIEEGIFPVLPEATDQPSAPVNNVELSISQQEAFSEPSGEAELLQFQPEAPAKSLELPQQETTLDNLQTSEEGEPSLTSQEAEAQPPELPNEFIAQPPEQEEITVSPLGDNQVQPPTLNHGVVTPTELLSREVEIESSTAREAPAQSSVSLEQLETLRDNQEPIMPQPDPAVKDEQDAFDREVPTAPTELAGEYSSDPPKNLPMSPDPSGAAVSVIQQELTAQSSGLISAQPSESPKDIEPFSVTQEEDADPLSEPPNEMEPSVAEQMTPPQPAEPLEEEEPSPAPPSAASPPPEPPEKVEFPPTQPMMLPELPGEPPSRNTAHPSPHSELTVAATAQVQAQQPSISFHPLDMEVTIIPEPTTDSEFSTALKTTAPPSKHHTVTPPPPDLVQTKRSKLNLLTVRPLHWKLIGTPGISAKVRPSPRMQETPSQPPEPPKETVVQTPASHKVKVVTPGLEPTQHPTSSVVTDQPLELTTAVLTIEAQDSVPLREAASPPVEQPGVVLTHPEQVQAQHPSLAEVTVQPLDVELVVTDYSVSNSTGKTSTVQEKQNARTNTSICELCTCQNETLSCTGLSPKYQLHQVPVLEPNTTFTTFNFQENAIFYLAENVWTRYKWAEKLNLSGNDLTELHKNSFKGLLSLQYLDLSCNKIQFIEAKTFEPLPFLQFLSLRGNLLTQLSFGTFRAWHRMPLLHTVILNHNPLSTVEDPYLFKLPALRYLDLGTTQTPLPVVENILMMTLGLKTLVIPRHMACCLCQFKSDIEAACKTVKLHCDGECVSNATLCLEEAPVGNAEGAFMKVLQARKNTKTELVMESEKSSSEQSDVSWSDLENEELDSNDANEEVGELNSMLPYFSEINVEDVDSLLPFIRLFSSNVQTVAHRQGYTKDSVRNPSHPPVPSTSAYRNELKKLYILQNWLNAEIQREIEAFKKKEKTAKLMQSSLSSPNFQVVAKKLASAQAQENSLVEDQHESKRLRTVDRVLKGPKGTQKRLLKERQKEKIREKQDTLLLAEKATGGQSLRSPSTGKAGQKEGALGPRNLAGNPLRTEEKAPRSSSLQAPLLGGSAISASAKALQGARNQARELTRSILILEHASTKIKNTKPIKPILGSKNGHGVHQTHSTPEAPRTLEANPREQLTKEDTRRGLKMAERPLFSALRSLIHSPFKGLLSSSGDLRTQEHPSPKLYAPAQPSAGSAAVETLTAGNAAENHVFTTNSPVPATDSAVTALTPMPTDEHTDEHTSDTHWEYNSTGSEQPPPETSVPLLPSPSDELETQLNQQFHILIPNKEVRRFVSYLIRTLKMDCSEPHLQLACAKLLSRTGLLMKLFSKQQQEKEAQARWDTKQWEEGETYISDSAGASGHQKEQAGLRDNAQDLPGHRYNLKHIVAISMMAFVMLLIVIFSLIETWYRRKAARAGKERPAKGLFGWRRKRSTREKDSEEGSARLWRPPWLRDVSKPLSAMRRQSMVQKLRDEDSSDETELFIKNKEQTSQASAEASAMAEEEDED
ncbi:leucine-rich repeat-containing protein 37A3 [Fukomys damarensis]|uniref:leucine-rich repeat-containing protein 37A3 n=1 Tax=Fukomys damarensis TaxID=885580 RepID=UPI00053FFA6E|nr:leucine-rich repeat-containing protein 37A3 [Fukomys damarensis]